MSHNVESPKLDLPVMSEEEAYDLGLFTQRDPKAPIGCPDGRPNVVSASAVGLINKINYFIDKRDDLPGVAPERVSDLGYTVIGGSWIVPYSAAMVATSFGIKVERDQLFELSLEAHEIAGLIPGIHVDTHGINEFGRYYKGCGAAKAAANGKIPNLPVSLTYTAREGIELAKKNNIKVNVLGHDHKENTAFLLYKEEKVLDKIKANSIRRQSFAHSVHAHRVLMAGMQEAARRNKYTELAEALNQPSVNPTEYLNAADEAAHVYLVSTLAVIAPHIINNNRIIKIQ